MNTASITTSSTKMVATLSELGKTYVYEDTDVVPTQFYADFAGREVRSVNQALKRIADTGRLTANHDFFCLGFEQNQEFCRITGCDLQSSRGITLLTRKSVNTLSHYFDDANSIGLSDTVNTIATGVMDRAAGRDGIAEEEGLVSLMRTQLAAIERGFALARECKEEISGLRTANDDDTLTAAQITIIDHLIHERTKSFGNRVVNGLIKRRIKARYFEIASTRTYKEIPRRVFDEVKNLIATWKPSFHEAELHKL